MRAALHWGIALGLMVGAAQAGFAKCQVGRIAELKVTMAGDMPLVDVGIEGHQVRLLADSGAFFSTIPRGSATELGLTMVPSPRGFVLSGVGGDVDAGVARVRNFAIAGTTLHGIEFVVGGSEVYGAAGMLGQNVLGLADVEYDLRHGAIRLMREKDCAKIGLAYWSGDRPVSTIGIEERSLERPHTIGTVLVNGVKVRAMFDTGAEASMLSLSAAARAGVKPGDPGVRADGVSHGIGRGVVGTWTAPFATVSLGDETIKHTQIQIGTLDLPDADMLIGADFFLSHRVYVANAKRTMYFTYEGGSVFSTGPARAFAADGSTVKLLDATPDPTDADGLARRGAAFAARQDWTAAIADLSKAGTLAPTNASYAYQLALAQLGADQPALASAALDRAVTADPASVEPRLMRAKLRLGRADRNAAEADMDYIDRALGPAADQRLMLAGMFERVDAYGRAIANYDRWIGTHGEDSRLPSARNGRCWTRALAGRDLGKALDDCNAAVRSRPGNANYLDSRGLVRLRMGDLDRAHVDYDAALKIAPRTAWSLYGRGIVERRQGLSAAGDADIAAAAAIDPDVGARAKRIGITG